MPHKRNNYSDLTVFSWSFSAVFLTTKKTPFRYRGYYYDTDTQLYYLQSRYYDPNLGGFLNADAYASTGQGILGNNMFAYCRNNSVNRIDILGYADTTFEERYDDDTEVVPPSVAGAGGASGSAGNGGTSGGSSAGGAKSTGLGFGSFSSLKSFLGSPGVNKHWHHIVEQCQIQKSGFPSEQVNNTSNAIAVDAQTHAQISGYYNTTTFPFTNGLSVRNWLAGQPYAVQFEFGLGVLRQFGIK